MRLERVCAGGAHEVDPWLSVTATTLLVFAARTAGTWIVPAGSRTCFERLARVFGCGDPGATMEWRVALMDAQKRLASKRRAKTQTQPSAAPSELRPVNLESAASADGAASSVEEQHPKTKRSYNLPRITEGLFANQHPMTLPALVWTGFAALAIITFIVGVESVTYAPVDGLDKQVGFLWAPSWTVLPIIIMPLFLGFVTALLNFWKGSTYAELARIAGSFDPSDRWDRKLQSFSYMFWIIFVLSFGFLFLLQWSGVHLRALLSGDASGYMMDWNIVALVRPDVVSVSEAIGVSFFAYMFFSTLMWLLFAGLVFLIVVSNDFREICSSKAVLSHPKGQHLAYTASIEIMRSVFRCAVLSILFATLIKIQSTYLLMSGEDILSWLGNDAMVFLGLSDQAVFKLNQRAIPQITTILLLVVSCAIFFVCGVHVKLFSRQWETVAISTDGTFDSHDNEKGRVPNIPWLPMIAVVALLSLNLMMIGAAEGFSLLLGMSALVAAYGIFDPMFGRAKGSHA